MSSHIENSRLSVTFFVTLYALCILGKFSIGPVRQRPRLTMFGRSKPKLFRQLVKSVTRIPDRLKDAKSGVTTYVAKKIKKLKQKKKPQIPEIGSSVPPVPVVQACVTPYVFEKVTITSVPATVPEHVKPQGQVIPAPVQLKHVLIDRKTVMATSTSASMPLKTMPSSLKNKFKGKSFKCFRLNQRKKRAPVTSLKKIVSRFRCVLRRKKARLGTRARYAHERAVKCKIRPFCFTYGFPLRPPQSNSVDRRQADFHLHFKV